MEEGGSEDLKQTGVRRNYRIFAGKLQGSDLTTWESDHMSVWSFKSSFLFYVLLFSLSQMHYTLCLFPEEVPCPEKYLQGPQGNCGELSWPGRSWARRRACRVPGSSSWSAVRIALVREGVYRGEWIIFLLVSPQIIHTALLQFCKADFSSKQRLLWDIWGLKSLWYLSAGVRSENALLL